jgi:hypothetical protein
MVALIPLACDRGSADRLIGWAHEALHKHPHYSTNLTASYMAHHLAETDPQRLIDLYEDDPESMAFVETTTHKWITAQGGNLIRTRIPLIDYARMAVAFGQNDPLTMFLEGATCTVRRYVEWRAAKERRWHEILPREKTAVDTPPEMSDTEALTTRIAAWYRAARDTGRPEMPSDGTFAGVLDVDAKVGDIKKGTYMRLRESHDRAPSDGADLHLGPLMRLDGGATERLVSTSGVDAHWADYTMHADRNADLPKRIEAGLVRNHGARHVLDLVHEAAAASGHTTGVCASRVITTSPYVPSLADLWTGPLYLFPGSLDLTSWGRFESAPMLDAAAFARVTL